MLLRHIGKGDLVKPDRTVEALRCLGIRRVGHLLRLLDKLKESRRAGNRVLELGHNARNLVERLCVLTRIAEKSRELADRQMPADHRESTDRADNHID